MKKSNIKFYSIAFIIFIILMIITAIANELKGQINPDGSFLSTGSGIVTYTGDNVDLYLPNFQGSKDPELAAYKMAHNAGFKARASYEFELAGQVYLVNYKDKIYSFWGFETTKKSAMLSYLAIFTKKVRINGKPPIKNNF